MGLTWTEIQAELRSAAERARAHAERRPADLEVVRALTELTRLLTEERDRASRSRDAAVARLRATGLSLDAIAREVPGLTKTAVAQIDRRNRALPPRRR